MLGSYKVSYKMYCYDHYHFIIIHPHNINNFIHVDLKKILQSFLHRPTP